MNRFKLSSGLCEFIFHENNGIETKIERTLKCRVNRRSGIVGGRGSGMNSKSEEGRGM